MSFSSFIKKLFADTGSSEQKPLTLDEIRKRMFETSRNMEMRNREAAVAEQKAQVALQKTFQPGVSAAQRSKLLAEHQRRIKEAKSFISYANQLGSVLETLETAETFMELSETISQSASRDSSVPDSSRNRLICSGQAQPRPFRAMSRKSSSIMMVSGPAAATVFRALKI